MVPKFIQIFILEALSILSVSLWLEAVVVYEVGMPLKRGVCTMTPPPSVFKW